MKKTAAMFTAVLSAAVMAVSASSSALTVFSAEDSVSETEICYEFENGKTDGGKIFTEGWKGNTAEDGSGEDYDLTNASNGGFSFLDQKGTTISVEVEVEEAGLYELTVCYCEPSDPNKKVQYLNINGVNQGEISFPHNLTFEETSGGIVMLEEGVN
ncbi:MAG: glycoside hydrolase, partial [Porcipelethomonas sp.]